MYWSLCINATEPCIQGGYFCLCLHLLLKFSVCIHVFNDNGNDNVSNRDPIRPKNLTKTSFSEWRVRVLVVKDISCSFCKGCFSYGLPKHIISLIKVFTKQNIIKNFINIWCKGRTHVCEETVTLINIHVSTFCVRVWFKCGSLSYSPPTHQ